MGILEFGILNSQFSILRVFPSCRALAPGLMSNNKLPNMMKQLLAFTIAAVLPLLAMADHPADWQPAGKAVYFEDLMTSNVDIKPGHCWVVDMEQSEAEPGWYRFQPYKDAGCYVARMMEEPDETYLYINASDSAKVYIEEFEAYPEACEYTYLNLVPENGWKGTPRYGKLADNVITFAPFSFALYDESYEIWHETSRTTGFRLELGNDQAHDYAVRAIPSVCNHDGYIFVKADAGNDVWDIKGYVAEGDYRPEMRELAVKEGFLLNSGETYQWEASKRGLHTFVAVGLDRNGNILSSDYNYAFNGVEDDSNWTDLDDTTMTEDILSGHTFGPIGNEVQSYTVKLQKHNVSPGYFRVVNPYAGHPVVRYPQYLADHSHNHYLYIDASDPAKVVLEASPVGVNAGYGDIWLSGASALTSLAADDAKYGSVDAEGWLTFPKGSLLTIDKNTISQGWREAGAAFRLLLPVSGSGISETQETRQREIWCNLQGVRVEKPSKGIFIRKTSGGKAEKRSFCNAE